MLRIALTITMLGTAVLIGGALQAAEVLLPQQRTAYYADESFELAVVGLAKGAKTAVELAPENQALSAAKFEVTGGGSTVNTMIPPGMLAPGSYGISLDGKAAPVKLTISSGVNDSTMLVSQVARAQDLKLQEGNFIVGNAAGFGVIGGDGLPAKEPRVRTGMLNTFDNAAASDLPTLVYMYWTGYVTHKPWGTRKSWSQQTMQETMRLFSFHIGQRLRRYGRNVMCIGTIDEPGLNWGRTPSGGWASGFANWDSRPWYEQRGWKFADNPASRDDADWMKYMTIRCGIIGESQAQARRDIMASWPDVKFETDVYAVHVVMDGADAMNQQANGETPTTHVFLGWGVGRDCAVTEMYIEKANNPAANIAHAMNGRLMGAKVPQPQHTICYHVMMNSMLAAGLKSNWWLNWGEMKPEEIATVNEPAKRYGPLVSEIKPSAHDVAVLWSFTELCMRQKDHAGKEAARKGGEQIKMMISALPENTAVTNKELVVSAYTISGNYRNQISYAHNALLRGGYPAHVIHERILPTGILKNYKTLVIIGQTFEFPPDTKQALAEFAAAGGRIIVDKTTTVKIDGAIITDADFKYPAYRWTPLFLEAQQNPGAFKTPKEASYFMTNAFMNEPILKAVGPMKTAMKKTGSTQFVVTDSTDLIIERHVGGEGAVCMILNAHQELPQIGDDEKYLIWNYAPHKASFTLQGIRKGSSVYAIEGVDWRKVSKIDDPSKRIDADFDAGEMKLYLVAPRAPATIRVSARPRGGAIEVSARGNLRMPWPVTVTVTDPAGREIYNVYRTLDSAGRYAEAFPIGSNAPTGEYAVKVASPVGYEEGAAAVNFQPKVSRPTVVRDAVRVFDAEAIEEFLAGQPEITIAIGADKYKPVAEGLAQALTARGITTTVVDERRVIRRARYPRVWDPYIKLYKNEGEEKKPEGKVEVEVNLEIKDGGTIVAAGPDGKNLAGGWPGWRKPGTLATVVGKGFIDYSAADGEECFEPGCRIYINEQSQRVVLKGVLTEEPATREAREKWSRPWSRLSSYNGAWNLPPQLPEAYSVSSHLILLGDSTTSELAAALQGSELLLQIVDARYPGPGKCLISFAWSPFALEKNVILIGATDDAGLKAGASRLVAMAE